MRCYRLVSPRYAGTALSGEGPRLYGGRWNSPGHRCVYAAESRALAILEILVHLTGRSRSLEWRLLTLDVPDPILSQIEDPPRGWEEKPAGMTSQSVGDTWIAAGKFAGLTVPSVLVPEESNVLLNPAAAGFEKVRVMDERGFQLDSRLA